MRARLEAISGRVFNAMRSTPNDELVSELQQVRVELSDLSSLLPAMKDYELSVTGCDTPEDLQVILTMIPTMVAELVISGKSKPSHQRSSRERAAITLLPLWAEEIYDVNFTNPPKLTGRNVSIELA